MAGFLRYRAVSPPEDPPPEGGFDFVPFGPILTEAEATAKGGWVAQNYIARAHYADVFNSLDGPTATGSGVYPAGYHPFGAGGSAAGATGGNYYDRGIILQKMALSLPAGARQTVLWGRADQQVLTYLDWAEDTNGANSNAPLWHLWRGLYYYVTERNPSELGRAQIVVGKMADLMKLPYYFDNLDDMDASDPRSGSPDAIDNREQTRSLQIFNLAYKISALYLLSATNAQANWLAALNTAMDRVLSCQQPDGSWPEGDVDTPNYGAHSIFRSGMLMSCLAEMYEEPGGVFEGDSRFPPVVKATVDYVWRTSWVMSSGRDQQWFNGTPHPSVAGFNYLDIDTPNTNNSATLAPGLNGMIAEMFGWTGKMQNLAVPGSGDRYLWKADVVRAGSLTGGSMGPETGGGGKLWNEHHSYDRDLVWCQGLPATPSPNRLIVEHACNYAPPRQNSTVYAREQIISIPAMPAHMFVCFVGGTSASSQPAAYTGTIALSPATSITDGGCTFVAIPGWTGTYTRPGDLSEDGVTPATQIAVASGSTFKLRFTDSTWPIGVTSRLMVRCKPTASGGATSVRLRTMNGDLSSRGQSTKLSLVAGWQTLSVSGNLWSNLTSASSQIEIGGKNNDGSSDGTIGAGNLLIGWAGMVIGDIAPLYTPTDFALDSPITGLNTATPIEADGIYYINGEEYDAPHAVVNGDVVNADPGVTVTVGRIRGLLPGISATAP